MEITIALNKSNIVRVTKMRYGAEPYLIIFKQEVSDKFLLHKASLKL